MPSYRVFCYDGTMNVWAADWIEAETDDEAIAAARRISHVVKCEVWQGKRLVASFALNESEKAA